MFLLVTSLAANADFLNRLLLQHQEVQDFAR